MDKFGERLRALREEKNISQEAFGKLFNLSQSTIAYYESNKKDPSRATLIKMAEYFGVSLDYLLGRTDIQEPARSEVLAAHRSDRYDTPLPQEAIEELENFKDYIRHKYRNWKPEMTQGEYLKKYGHNEEGGEKEI